MFPIIPFLILQNISLEVLHRFLKYYTKETITWRNTLCHPQLICAQRKASALIRNAWGPFLFGALLRPGHGDVPEEEGECSGKGTQRSQRETPGLGTNDSILAQPISLMTQGPDCWVTPAFLLQADVSKRCISLVSPHSL